MSERSPQSETAEKPVSQRGEVTFSPPAPTRAQLASRRQFRRALRRAKNPLYIPMRWLILMFAAVLLVVAAVATLLVSLRGEASAPPLEPVIEIVTSSADQPEAPIAADATAEPATADDSAPQVILAAETPASLVLTGPAVPTVVITNTPIPLAVGLQALVFNVGNDELNVRNIPSLRESQVLFRAPSGTRFKIIAGPQEADGYTWWQVHDAVFEVIGWAVANYLQTIPESTG